MSLPYKPIHPEEHQAKITVEKRRKVEGGGAQEAHIIVNIHTHTCIHIVRWSGLTQSAPPKSIRKILCDIFWFTKKTGNSNHL